MVQVATTALERESVPPEQEPGEVGARRSAAREEREIGVRTTAEGSRARDVGRLFRKFSTLDGRK